MVLFILAQQSLEAAVTVTVPPRPPRPSDPVDREELEALVEALIEEARQRARRRRRRYAAGLVVAVLAGLVVVTALGRAALESAHFTAPGSVERCIGARGTGDRFPAW